MESLGSTKNQILLMVIHPKYTLDILLLGKELKTATCFSKPRQTCLRCLFLNKIVIENHLTQAITPSASMLGCLLG